MIVEGTFEVDAPREELYRHIINPELMAVCIPGCESIEQLDAARYRAVVSVGLGGISARFNLVVEVTKETPPESVHSVTRGEEGGRASTITANNEVLLLDLDDGRTQVRYVSDVSVTGRLGKFALGVMKKKAQSMGLEFAGNLKSKLQTMSGLQQEPAEAVAAPADDRRAWWKRG